MDFVWKLYGNTYAVHVTVALVGVATLNLALPAPPGKSSTFCMLPSVDDNVHRSGSSVNSVYLASFWMLSKLEYKTMRCHIKHGKVQWKIIYVAPLCNIGIKNGFRFDHNEVLNMVITSLKIK